MTGFVELRGGGQTGGPGTDDGDFFAGAFGWRFGGNPAFIPAFVDNRGFDVFNRDWRVVDAEHAGAFAGCGTDAAGEFREVVGFVESV
jgi:hypothetical protein